VKGLIEFTDTLDNWACKGLAAVQLVDHCRMEILATVVCFGLKRSGDAAQV
jgi:hypothetical protein